MEAKYCSKCGKPIDSGKRKCSECKKKQTKKVVLIILTFVLIRLITFGIELSMRAYKSFSEQNLKESEHEETQIEYERFNGWYTNDGKHPKNKTIEKILSTIENQTFDDPRIISGTTYKDFIYYFVEDPDDCFPSEEHSQYCVIVDVGKGLIDKENYRISYIIGIANTSVDLSFEMSDTFENIQILDVTLRNKNSFWFEDFSQGEMRTKVADLAVLLTPNLRSLSDTNSNVNTVSNESNSVSVYDYTPTYLFPSDTVYITEKDLSDLSKYEVALIRNEIYARHGYIFKQEQFKTYFNTQDWYTPNESFSTSMFNEIERVNIDFIAKYEKKMDEIIRKENFEERVDWGQRPFYDETVFTTFFDDKYGSDFEWSYIGATYSTFVVDDYESFDVYKIFFPNDIYEYYLVPFPSENKKNYSVYKFVEGEQLKLIWKQ